MTGSAVTTMRGHRSRGETGSASIWALLLTVGAFTALLGLIVDGGRVIEERLESSRVAAQAARDAVDELSQASVRSGHDDVDVQAAISRAQTYLQQAGKQGTVHVAGNSVTVTITGTSDTEILSVIGIDSFPVRETQTARSVTEETP